jgi:ubiquinone/menaquinone biosynthesis C-methylase UbiE
MTADPEAWNRQAADFDQEPDHGLADPATRRAWQELLLPLLPGRPGSVADLGCGTGTLSLLLAEAGHQVHGLDFSPTMLDLARDKTRSVTPMPVFTEGDAANPPLPAASFDVVLSRHVLWAMPDPAAALRNWRALLRAGGRLVLIEGEWSTGAGLPAATCESLLRELGGTFDIRPLSDEPLWGGPITDDRYLAISHPD